MGAKLDNAKALYLEGIRDGNAREAVEKYTGDRYTQHSTGVADGVEGFVEFFEPFIERNPERDIQIVRGWEDGRYVFLQVYQDINNGEAEWVTTDFFDTDENDKIVEHWDVITKYEGPDDLGRTQLGGGTEIADLDKTEGNKAIVRRLIENVCMDGGDPTLIDQLVVEDFVQHRVQCPDGRRFVSKFMLDEERPLAYDEVVLCVGQGNFVATLCKATWGDTPLAQVDIWRVEDDLIVEHWDNVEPVPENDVNSGKF